MYGTVNTAVLLTSSLTMAVAAQAEAQADFRRLIVWCLAATAALGLTFACPERVRVRRGHREGPRARPGFALKEPAAQIFFALYWILTGIHAIHLSIGIVLVGRLCLWAR